MAEEETTCGIVAGGPGDLSSIISSLISASERKVVKCPHDHLPSYVFVCLLVTLDLRFLESIL